TRAAAFSVARGGVGEEVVVVLEVGEPGAATREVEAEVRSRIGREMGLPVADVVLLRRGRIPRTTSGKVRRKELRQRYLEGRLERLGG
ncbi:MAG: AMP-dependent synthetase, partial [Thermoanaerobaculia bacterium]|nr:AMP-dependent synthetase [Thermoanaerobaculia bacterium]